MTLSASALAQSPPGHRLSIFDRDERLKFSLRKNSLQHLLSLKDRGETRRFQIFTSRGETKKDSILPHQQLQKNSSGLIWAQSRKLPLRQNRSRHPLPQIPKTSSISSERVVKHEPLSPICWAQQAKADSKVSQPPNLEYKVISSIRVIPKPVKVQFTRPQAVTKQALLPSVHVQGQSSFLPKPKICFVDSSKKQSNLITPSPFSGQSYVTHFRKSIELTSNQSCVRQVLNNKQPTAPVQPLFKQAFQNESPDLCPNRPSNQPKKGKKQVTEPTQQLSRSFAEKYLFTPPSFQHNQSREIDLQNSFIWGLEREEKFYNLKTANPAKSQKEGLSIKFLENMKEDRARKQIEGDEPNTQKIRKGNLAQTVKNSRFYDNGHRKVKKLNSKLVDLAEESLCVAMANSTDVADHQFIEKLSKMEDAPRTPSNETIKPIVPSKETRVEEIVVRMEKVGTKGGLESPKWIDLVLCLALLLLLLQVFT